VGRELTGEELKDALNTYAKSAALPPALPLIQVGAIVLVGLGFDRWRPMIVSAAAWDAKINAQRLFGSVFCEPEDHNTDALRGILTTHTNPVKFTGRPDRHNPVVYAEEVPYGVAPGCWRPR
jgi:hypothetical protein